MTMGMRPYVNSKVWIEKGVGSGQFASLNPLNVHERGSGKLEGLVRVYLHFQASEEAECVLSGTHLEISSRRRERFVSSVFSANSSSKSQGTKGSQMCLVNLMLSGAACYLISSSDLVLFLFVVVF